MKISNHSSLDELIKRSADMDLLRQELKDDEESSGAGATEFNEEEWNNWLKANNW